MLDLPANVACQWRRLWGPFPMLVASIVLAGAPAADAGVLLSADLTESNGDLFSVANLGDDSWNYVSGDGWISNTPAAITDSLLTTPVIDILGDVAKLRVEFVHDLDYEIDFDTGVLMVSVDGKRFQIVSEDAFSEGGYNGLSEGKFGNLIPEGTPVFTGEATNLRSAAVVATDLKLGNTVQVAWRSSSDVGVSDGDPEWVLKSVTIATDPIPEPSTLGFGMFALVCFSLRRRRSRLLHHSR